jgi:hypothetical protein
MAHYSHSNSTSGVGTDTVDSEAVNVISSVDIGTFALRFLKKIPSLPYYRLLVAGVTDM